jgi:hypothetical protein
VDHTTRHYSFITDSGAASNWGDWRPSIYTETDRDIDKWVSGRISLVNLGGSSVMTRDTCVCLWVYFARTGRAIRSKTGLPGI